MAVGGFLFLNSFTSLQLVFEGVIMRMMFVLFTIMLAFLEPHLWDFTEATNNPNGVVPIEVQEYPKCLTIVQFDSYKSIIVTANGSSEEIILNCT